MINMCIMVTCNLSTNQVAVSQVTD